MAGNPHLLPERTDSCPQKSSESLLTPARFCAGPQRSLNACFPLKTGFLTPFSDVPSPASGSRAKRFRSLNEDLIPRPDARLLCKDGIARSTDNQEVM